MIMKNSINKYFGLALLFISASCADDKFVDFKTEKPESIAQYEYLNAYDALKTYIDRSTHPNFKLGVGVAANDFLKGEMVRSVAVANFDEVVAGNAMKYASIVADDGSMDFGTVTKFVEAAKTSGLTVYGHTLCWHSQQNNKWLNSLIANKPKPVDPSSVNRVLHIVAGEPKDNVWDWEIYYDLDNVLEIGKQYTLTLRIKGSNPGAFSFWPGMKDGSNTHYGFPECTSGEGWIDNTIVFTPTSSIDRLRFCFGKLGGDLYFDDVVLKADGSEANLLVNSSFDEDDISHWTTVSWMGLSYGVEELGESGSTVWFESIITNGDAEGEDVSCFYATEDGKGGPYAAPIGETGTGADGVGRAFIVKSADNPAEDHSTQFFVKANTVLKEGDICKLSFKYKADKAAGSDSQTHKKPGEYIFYDAGVSVNFTTQWQKFEKEFTVTEQMVTNEGVQPFQTIAWNLAKFKEANTYYFDDIEFGIQKKAEGIPLTPEEKKEVLTNELERWIKGMMEACGGSVTACTVLYPGRNVLIVDFGTAVTIDLVTADNTFRGGCISPGMKTRFRALHDYTACLPLCGPTESGELQGLTTEEAIRLGVMNSLTFEIEGYMARMEKKIDDLCVIFTGGDAKYFAKRIKNTIFANCNLVFCGLDRILEYNASEEHLD